MVKKDKTENILVSVLLMVFAISAYKQAIPIFDLNNPMVNLFVIIGSMIFSFLITSILKVVFKGIYRSLR